MKKLCSLLLVFTIIFSLCACGGGNEATTELSNETTTELSKEEMLTQAEELKLDDLSYELKNNEVRAKELYNDKLVKINDFEVEDISSYEDHATVDTTYWGNFSVLTVTVNLSNEDVMSLNRGDKITVVGTLNVKSMVSAEFNDAFIVK